MRRLSRLNETEKLNKDNEYRFFSMEKERIDSVFHPNPKGQWFLVSAVIITGAFLTISILFKDYLIVDQSAVARMDEDFYFHNIREGLDTIVADVGFLDCDSLKTKLDEFIFFSKERMAEKGYYLYAKDAKDSVDCGEETATFGILLASERMIVYENVDPEDILTTTTTI